jgi:hypothetical protein
MIKNSVTGLYLVQFSLRSMCEFEYMQSGIECSNILYDTLNFRAHRLATVTFLRTFHHDRKISPGWWGGGGRCMPTPFHYVYHHVQSCGAGSRADTLPPSSLPLYVLYSLNLCLGSRVCTYIHTVQGNTLPYDSKKCDNTVTAPVLCLLCPPWSVAYIPPGTIISSFVQYNNIQYWRAACCGLYPPNT